MAIYGPHWPLKRGNKDTYQVYDSLKDQINFYLKNLLLTSPGENISAPLYGVGLRRFLFENNTEETRGAIRSKIRMQINSYLSYLKIKNISVDANSEEIDSNTLKIKIIYSIPKEINNEEFEISLQQSQDIGFY